jgi:Putative adhesin
MQRKSHRESAAKGSSRSTLGSFFLRTGIYGAFLVVVITGLCGRSFAYDETFHRVYPLTAGGSFVLENVNGSVHVDGWDRDEVEVSAVKTSTNESRDMQQVKIEVDNSKPGQIAVHTLYPKGEGAEVAVEYHVHVPYRVLLGSIGTVNGSVIVRGVEGGGELRSVNGNVEVFNSSGRFSEKTTNGDIRLELHELLEGGPMNLETVNGSVLLGLPAGARADLKVLSMNGDVYSELPVPRISGALTPHAFKAKLGNGGGEISVRTVNGGIRLLQSPGV